MPPVSIENIDPIELRNHPCFTPEPGSGEHMWSDGEGSVTWLWGKARALRDLSSNPSSVTY